MTIAELLKNCPQGMELKCTMWDKVILDHVDMNSNYPIRIKKMGGEIESLTENGCFNFDLGAKCVIFPTDKDTWYGFVPPLNFKDGDIVYFERYGNKYLAIFKKIRCNFLCTYTYFSNISISLSVASYDIKCLKEIRLATEKEKENLFKELKHQGYRWNAETKTLEKLIKPKFKIGDVIQDKEGYKVEITHVEIDDECYLYLSKIANGIGTIDFKDQDEWNLVSINKFDISTLVPFESRVLVRNHKSQTWRPAIWGFFDENCGKHLYGVVGGNCFSMCIPFEGNEHLIGKDKDCDEFYQTWKE